MNYRLLKDFSIDLEDNLSLIIGKNNSGKTSVLYVLDKFINSSSKTKFSWDDFSIKFRQDLDKSIKDNYKYVYDNENFPGIYLRIFVKYESNDDLSNLSDYMLDLDENNNFIILEFSYMLSYNEFSNLNDDYLKTTDKNDFLEKNFEKYFKLNTKSIIYDKDNEKEGTVSKNIKANINKLISFKYLAAKRDTSNEEENKISNLASNYYKNIDNNLDDEIINTFNEIIDGTDDKIDGVYNEIFKDITNKIKKFGGVKEEESLIKIISSINKEKLLEGNSKVIYEEDNYQLPENYNGLGYLNLFYMIFDIELKLMDFRKDSEEDDSPADINLFFIEEPEVHTHPQMQYIFIENIKKLLSDGCKTNGNKLNLQTILSTHSSHIVSKCDFNDIKYFYKDNINRNIISKNLTDLEREYDKNIFKFLKQYLTLNRSELFFTDKAIFIEGDTERILLPNIMKMIDESGNTDSLPLLSQNISIVEVGNHSKIFEKFIDFIGLKTLILTDIDSGKLNERNTVVKCSVDEGTRTTNSSLRFFFSKKLRDIDKNEELEKLKSLKFKNKVFIKIDGKWSENEEGILMVSYQTFNEEKNYYPRTFEDAFISLNKQFIIDNKKIFDSLKNKEEIRSNNDFYKLTENIIGKKPDFAIEILIANNVDENISWSIPDYIKEGLLWLKKS